MSSLDSQMPCNESERLFLECSCQKSTHSPLQPSPTFRALRNGFVTLAAFVIISFSLNVVLLCNLSKTNTSARFVLKAANSYSPALDAIDPELLETKFAGNFGTPSRWRGEPSPELDASWQSITTIRVGRMSEAELVSSGFTTDHVKIPEEHGGGYLMELEMSHQLHCLNMLRQTSYFNFAYYHNLYPSWIADQPEMRGHIGHCTEMLRQALMCNADVGLIPMVWATNRTLPIPDFNTWHKCKNWDSAVDFAKGRSLPQMKMWKPAAGEKKIVDPLNLHNEKARRHYTARLSLFGLDVESI